MNVIVAHVMSGTVIESLFGVFETKEAFKESYRANGFIIDELSGVLVSTDGTEKILTWQNCITSK